MRITERATVCGHQVAVLRRDPDADDGVDPCFFEADFTVAASTARLIWEGSWALVELLRRERDSWLRELVRGRRVLELGAGTGMLGLAAAAAGGHVLMTDVASMTEESLAPNVRANVAAGGGCPSWTGSDSAVSSGSAAAQALDWLLPLEAQRHPVDVFAAEIVLAAECAWLEELVDPFVATLAALLAPRRASVCIFAFRERARASSTCFVSGEEVLRRLGRAGCDVRRREAVAGRPGMEEAAGGNTTQIFEVRRRGAGADACR